MAIAGFHHLGLKIASIALAALLWVIVSGEQIVERALRIPLEFTNLPAQLEIIGDALNVVDVRVRGSSGALSRIAAGELVAVLDLRTARSGPPRLFHLTAGDVRVPFGVEVVQVTPSSLSMTFEPSVSKTVPVIPEVDGEPAPGFVVSTITADPDRVVVVGPASAVEMMTEAITEPVSIRGATAVVIETATIGSPDPLVRLLEPQAARVTVNVGQAPAEWAVAGVAVRTVNGRPGVQLSPRTVTVHVRGPRAAMQATAADFDVSIDVAGLKPGQYALPVRVVPPGRVGVVSVEPQEIRVRVR
jgi:YbbR domain-containing protein